MGIEDTWTSLDVIFILLGSEACLVSAAVLYLYPAKEDVGFHLKTDATDLLKGASSVANIMHC